MSTTIRSKYQIIHEGRKAGEVLIEKQSWETGRWERMPYSYGSYREAQEQINRWLKIQAESDIPFTHGWRYRR